MSLNTDNIIMLKQARRLLIFLMIYAGLSLQTLAGIKEHNILIIHSYHQGLEWTDSISSGVMDVFKDRTDINLFFEYLDIKRNYTDDYFDLLYDLYKAKERKDSLSAIIVSDNGAYDFMRMHGDELYPGVPVLFCGVNNLDTNELDVNCRYRGIMERPDYLGSIQAVTTIFPEKKKVFIINDNTITGKAMKTELISELENFNGDLEFIFVSNFTIESLLDQVKSLDEEYAIYLLVINRDMYGNFISYRKGITMINKQSKVPIFGSWDFYQGKGLFGGKIIRGKAQGNAAAQLALKIVDGEALENLPLHQILDAEYVFDYNEMLRFGVDHSRLPEGSVVANRPESRHVLVQILVIVTGILLLGILILVINLRVKMNRQSQMEEIIQKRTVELNNTNAQLSEIIEGKDKFFSILAHDLRSSVGVFMNFSLLLNTKEYSANEKRRTDVSNKLQIAAAQTFGLVEDLLFWGINQFSRNQNIETVAFSPENTIDSILERYTLNLNNVSFKCVYNNSKELISDVNIFQFIVRNILQNAIKYSHEGGEVRIHTESINDGVRIIIEDDGIGMDEQIIQSIFAKKPIKKAGGKGEYSTGMGLLTVMDYLERLEGQLNVESQLGRGSRFIIKFSDL
jgi:signal transduction histidine kinase